MKGAKFCLPEQEIRDRFPIQWEENPLQETTTKKGVTDEVELEKRPKVAKNGSSSLREESLLEEVSKDAEVRGLDESKTGSEPRPKIKNGFVENVAKV